MEKKLTYRDYARFARLTPDELYEQCEVDVFRATGPGGSVDRAFYISVRPDVTGGAFGTPYVTVYNGVTVSTLTTIAATDTCSSPVMSPIPATTKIAASRNAMLSSNTQSRSNQPTLP